MSACVGMRKLWRDEVRSVKREVCFQECWGQSGECAPCRPPFSLGSSSVTVHPLQPAGDLFISTSLGCCGCISISTMLQILSVRGFNKSQPYSPFSNCKDRPVCLSHHFQLLLDFTYSPEPQCVHTATVLSHL